MPRMSRDLDDVNFSRNVSAHPMKINVPPLRGGLSAKQSASPVCLWQQQASRNLLCHPRYLSAHVQQ